MLLWLADRRREQYFSKGILANANCNCCRHPKDGWDEETMTALTASWTRIATVLAFGFVAALILGMI